MNYLQLILKTLLIIVATLIGLRIFTLLLHRVPGLFVSLSAISIGILLVAMYRGSFQAVGLKNRKAISIALIASLIIFIGSGIVLLYVDRP